MGMKGNADDYEKGIDHSVSINSGRGLALRMRKNQENRKQGRRRLIPCLLFRTIRDVRPKCRAVEWYQDTV